MTAMRMLLVRFLWLFPCISRRWCRADAVIWAHYPEKGIGIIERVYDNCYYCSACHTKKEMIKYQARIAHMVQLIDSERMAYLAQLKDNGSAK